MAIHNWSKVPYGLIIALFWTLSVAKPSSAYAQQTNTAITPLAFEVATVKPDDPGKMTMIELRVYPGGRLVIHGHTLGSLIAEAFNIPANELVGGEKWLGEVQFDIEGRPSEEMRRVMSTGEYSNFGIQDPRVRSMLQALLVERFHLKFHIETQPGTVYLLERGNGPLRLKPAEINLYIRSEDGTVAPSNAYPTGDFGLVSGRTVGFHQVSMPQFARVLSNLKQTAVSDKTQLSGYYNFTSQTVVTDEDFKNGGPFHLLVESLPEMGLKLVKTNGQTEKFVIDNVELPTAN